MKTKIGKVMNLIDHRTAKVGITTLIKHPVYGKYMRRCKRYLVDNLCGAQCDDVVEIEHGKFSKLKTARIVKVVKSAIVGGDI